MYSDEELSQMFGRSVFAIQVKRRKIAGKRTGKPNRKYANGVCDMTCPDYCPYKDCKLSGAQILTYEYRLKKKKGVTE
jgi:hypothetical protein